VSRRNEIKKVTLAFYNPPMLRHAGFICAVAILAIAQSPSTRPSFTDYPVKEIFSGEPAEPKFATRDERFMETRIRRGAKGAVAFAGHYTLPGWGCGAGCIGFAIVDSISGRIYGLPGSLEDLPYQWLNKHEGESHKRIDYRPDSRLMKFDACVNEVDCGFYDYIMVDGEGLKLVRKELLPAEFQPKP
jgi:hypothetical protein